MIDEHLPHRRIPSTACVLHPDMVGGADLTPHMKRGAVPISGNPPLASHGCTLAHSSRLASLSSLISAPVASSLAVLLLSVLSVRVRGLKSRHLLKAESVTLDEFAL